MRATIPATVDRFQQALDMLEIEILKAKAVLHRDLTKFHTAAELARQKELEEQERKAALEREAEEERIRLQKETEEAEKASAAAAAAAAAQAAAEAEAAAAAAAAAVVIPQSTDLEMLLDEEPPMSAQEPKDTDMDHLFGDMNDVDSLKVEEVSGADSHALEMSDIPLVAPSASKNGEAILLDDDNKASIKIKSEPSPDDDHVAVVAAAVAATLEDPIILDSPLMPAAEGDAEEPSAVDLFGEDPLNPIADGKDTTSAAGGAGGMSIEEQIDMDFLFPGDSSAGGAGAGDVANAASAVDDLFGDLGVDTSGDAGKLDMMNLDIPGLSTEAKGDEKPKEQGGAVVAQPEIDINALGDPAASFDDLFASLDGSLLGQLGNDETSLFDDAFDIYNNP
ncbi:hypothetical protein TWF694_002331 [Orbilia ellipsospora]|uniref:Uncharacterized protein n=1 Tax=Orbilia ellipsospora TaxID=2528407 RepID=A0AAV9X1P9_9PEZI